MENFNVLLLLLLMPIIRGCVENWPKNNTCCPNYRFTETGCIPCETGTYGVNCSESCPDGQYGDKCFSICNCTEGEICDKGVGCINSPTPRNGLIVCKCTNEKICGEEVGCVEAANTTNGSTDAIGGITSLYNGSKEPIYTTKAKFDSTEDTEAHVNLDGVQSSDVIIIGSSLVSLCIISVISYFFYSKRTVKRKRRKRGRPFPAPDVRNTADHLKGDDCVYNKIESIYVEESPLPLTISDSLYGHKDDPVYHTLSLRLDLRNEKFLDPPCICIGPRKPHSVSNINVHSAYEEPSISILKRAHSEGESDFSMKTNDEGSKGENIVDIPQRKRSQRHLNQDVNPLISECAVQDRNNTIPKSSREIEIAPAYGDNPYLGENDKRILKSNFDEQQSTLKIKAGDSAFVHQIDQVDMPPEDADLGNSRENEDYKIQIADVCEQEQTNGDRCRFIDIERNGSQLYEDAMSSYPNNSHIGTTLTDGDSSTDIIE
ncbi:multiple epidermal growth factor-like domains protein 10 [Saccostrea cucullata]|uniref:multiple epidermal growth factor-like domains protein 10 n=1 Tax=Saccostrea cuccullata TaxID=36930 RepID=UPI002ED49423